MFAVCNNCKNHIHDVQNDAAPQVWYNHFCGARERPPMRDPQTGKMMYKGGNDLGMVFAGDQKYEYCRDVNDDGSCEFYQPIKELSEA